MANINGGRGAAEEQKMAKIPGVIDAQVDNDKYYQPGSRP